MDYTSAQKLLAEKGQTHLLQYYDELDETEKKSLLEQIENIDWDTVALRPRDGGERHISPIDGMHLEEVTARQKEFEKIGIRAIGAGKVAAVLLAGGQGTRLGSDAPKGCYNIGITRPLYIFEQLINNLHAVCNRCMATVPLYIMTSEINDAETREFFHRHDYFGYPEGYVKFFRQEMAPCVGLDGKILLEGKGRLALSPNGNGGWFSSLARAGLLDDMKKRGVEWVNVFAVDNVLQRIADPVFVGATIESGKKCGAKVVCKSSPEERVGVLCIEDGKPSVVEYYEMSPETAKLQHGVGKLVYSFGVILNYLFDLKKLEETAGARVPIHVAKKKVPYFKDGALVSPERENGYKFETLILDMVKLMGDCLPVEVEREREFAPIKNQTGVDSVESARALLEKNGVKL